MIATAFTTFFYAWTMIGSLCLDDDWVKMIDEESVNANLINIVEKHLPHLVYLDRDIDRVGEA